MSWLTNRAIAFYPEASRNELVDALSDKYGEKIPIRESVRVLTNGLELRARHGSSTPGDLVRRSAFNGAFLYLILSALAIASWPWRTDLHYGYSRWILVGAFATLMVTIATEQWVGTAVAAVGITPLILVSSLEQPSASISSVLILSVFSAALLIWTLQAKTRKGRLLAVTVGAAIATIGTLTTVSLRSNYGIYNNDRLGGRVAKTFVFMVPVLLILATRRTNKQRTPDRWPIAIGAAIGAAMIPTFDHNNKLTDWLLRIVATAIIGFLVVALAIVQHNPVPLMSAAFVLLISASDAITNIAVTSGQFLWLGVFAAMLIIGFSSSRRILRT
jgi:hypothetical protein